MRLHFAPSVVAVALVVTMSTVLLGCHAPDRGSAIPQPTAGSGTSNGRDNPIALIASSSPVPAKDFAQTLADFTKTTIDSGVRIVCAGTTGIGSGFIHSSGVVITAAHVVRRCRDPKQNLTFRISNNTAISLRDGPLIDDRLDLAILLPSVPVGPGVKLYTGPDLTIGMLAGIGASRILILVHDPCSP